MNKLHTKQINKTLLKDNINLKKQYDLLEEKYNVFIHINQQAEKAINYSHDEELARINERLHAVDLV